MRETLSIGLPLRIGGIAEALRKACTDCRAEILEPVDTTTAPTTDAGPDHRGLAAKRVTVAAASGLVATFATLLAGASWSVATLVGWDAAALVFLGWVWLTVPITDAAAAARIARAEDASRTASEVVLLGAGVASLVAVAYTLVEAGNSGEPARGLLTALAIASVTLAWACVQTVYALRYARLYYSDPIGGIDFNEDDRPDYLDLAYLALTIGMTFQVSDTDLTTKRIRRTAIRHALLSYVFGTVIVAVTINIVAGLLGH
jgi:uncharacterized membrane protein